MIIKTKDLPEGGLSVTFEYTEKERAAIDRFNEKYGGGYKVDWTSGTTLTFKRPNPLDEEL